MSEDYMNCAVVRSGEEFSVPDFARCARTSNRIAKEILDDLSRQHKLSCTVRHGCFFYKKRTASLVDSMKLANYEPPRPNELKHASRWVTF